MSRTLQMALDALDNLGSMSDKDVTPYAWRAAKAEAACTALREALAQPAPERWMPIETAPKDVTILLYGAKRLEMCVGMHHSRDGWVTDTTSEWMSMYPPTHWMPLPAAPDHLRDTTEKAAPAAPVPAGWVMVPREPTPVPLVEGGYAELATRMRGRADFIRDQGGIKSAELMEQGADAITFLAAPPVAPAHVPLTDSELAKIAVEDEFLLYCDQDSFNEIARAIELTHGITGASK